MVEPPEDPRTPGDQEPLGEHISRRANRKLRARNKDRHSAWFGLGMFGLVGWSIAIPSLIGVALGLWMDGRWPDGPSWTLTFLIIGVAVGCLNAWYWVKQESQRE
jgi:ATP synthase protein I